MTGTGKRKNSTGADKGCHTQRTVDAFHIPPAPILAHQDTQAALDAEDDADEQKHRHIGGGDSGHLLVTQLAHHKGVNQPQGEGDEVLQDDGQGQRPQPFVKAGFPAEMVQHDIILLQ